MSNFPPKPQFPCNYNPDDCGHHPPPPHHGCDCHDTPPMPPMRPSPGCFPIQPEPGFNQIPPVPSVIEGSSLYEAMNVMVARFNKAIEQYNQNACTMHRTLQECVHAARLNDVYYDQCEVSYQEGYDADEGCSYSIVEKKVVDAKGKPIFVKLVPAYNNTTNSGVKQGIFDVSWMKNANVIITAVPPDQNTWNGPAMYRGAPIPGTETESGYVYGFNRHGVLKFFQYDVTETSLCQTQMVDVIGGCIPIISDGAITEQAQELNTKSSICAIGYNVSTGSVFFFNCSAQDQVGMTGISVANLLKGYGCTTAVITAIIAGDNKNVSAGMLYLANMAQVPQGGKVPTNLAYWVVSKCANFNNSLEDEIAKLVQSVGQNAWKNYLLGVEILDFDDRITNNYNLIKQEEARAMEAERMLQENINNEVNRATEAEKELQENINNEVNRATQAEKELDDKITAETQRATEAENNLHQEIVDETTRATQRENQIAADLAAEKLRAQNRENEIQSALDSEIAARIAADNDLINAIEQETLARRAADAALQNTIDAVNKQLKQDINDVQNIVNGITGGQTNLPYLKLTGGTLSGSVNFSSTDTITVGRGPTSDLEVATKKYVDDAVASGTTPGGDVTKEYVDQQISVLQEQVTDKVSKTGDTMSGALNMAGQQIQNAVLSSNTGTRLDDGAGGPGKITNLALPTSDVDAASKLYVDTSISKLPQNAVLRTGDTMTGTLNMQDNAQIDFYSDENGEMGMLALDPNPTDEQLKAQVLTATGRISKTAKTLGITKELMDLLKENSLVNDGSTVAEVYALVTNGDAPTGALTGSIYNNQGHMVVESYDGDIHLKGDTVISQTPSGTYAPVQASELQLPGSGAIRGHNGHVDVNSQDSLGAMYINRTNNGTVQEGGTGELHVAGIHAPQALTLEPTSQLILDPGTTVQVKKEVNLNGNGISNASSISGMNGVTISGNNGASVSFSAKSINLNLISGDISANNNRLRFVADPTTEQDAVNLRTLQNYTYSTENLIQYSGTLNANNSIPINATIGNVYLRIVVTNTYSTSGTYTIILGPDWISIKCSNSFSKSIATQYTNEYINCVAFNNITGGVNVEWYINTKQIQSNTSSYLMLHHIRKCGTISGGVVAKTLEEKVLASLDKSGSIVKKLSPMSGSFDTISNGEYCLVETDDNEVQANNYFTITGFSDTYSRTINCSHYTNYSVTIKGHSSGFPKYTVNVNGSTEQHPTFFLCKLK